MTTTIAPATPASTLLDRLPKPLREVFSLLQQSFQEWNADNVPRLAAALSYYVSFSMAPLLVVVIAVVGLIIGSQGAQDQIIGQIRGELGEDVATLFAGAITGATQPRQGLISTVIGLLGLLLGALGVFEQLKNALNTIWGVQPARTEGNSGILGFIRTFVMTKLLSFGMLLAVGFLLLVSLVLSSLAAGVSNQIVQRIPAAAFALEFGNFFLAFAITTVLIALIYKFLPETEIKWRDVAVGAAFTSLLFSIGRLALSQYLAGSGTQSVYGAAGALAVFLLWVYYSAQIILFGAEFTQVYASRHGSRAAEPVRKIASAQIAMIQQASAEIDRRARESREVAREVLGEGQPAQKTGRSPLVNLVILLGIMGSALLVGFTGKDRE